MIFGSFDINTSEIVFTSIHEHSINEFMKKLTEESKKSFISFRCSGTELIINFEGVEPDTKHFDELKHKLFEKGVLEVQHPCTIIGENKFRMKKLQKGVITATCDHNCQLKRKDNCSVLSFINS